MAALSSDAAAARQRPQRADVAAVGDAVAIAVRRVRIRADAPFLEVGPAVAVRVAFDVVERELHLGAERREARRVAGPRNVSDALRSAARGARGGPSSFGRDHDCGFVRRPRRDREKDRSRRAATRRRPRRSSRRARWRWRSAPARRRACASRRSARHRAERSTASAERPPSTARSGRPQRDSRDVPMSPSARTPRREAVWPSRCAEPRCTSCAKAADDAIRSSHATSVDRCTSSIGPRLTRCWPATRSAASASVTSNAHRRLTREG